MQFLFSSRKLDIDYTIHLLTVKGIKKKEDYILNILSSNMANSKGKKMQNTQKLIEV